MKQETKFSKAPVFELQPWTKLVETKVENPVNSRNDSIFQIPISAAYPPNINVESGQVLLSKA